MAKKKKKKQSHHQKEKIAKAQHRNEFYRKLRYIIKHACSQDIFFLIPQDILKKTYDLRYHSVKVVAGKGQVIPNYDLKEFSRGIKERLETTTIEISSGKELSLADFLSVGLTFIKLCYAVEKEEFEQSEIVKPLFKKYLDEDKHLPLANKEMISIINLMGVFTSRIDKNLYWLKHNITNEDDIWGLRNFIEVYKETPETINVVIDNISRPVTEVCWAIPYEGLEEISVKPSELNIENTTDDLPMKVYMQSHAFNRLHERMDVLNEFALHYCIYISFLELKVIRNINNNILIEYRVSDKKLGYLLIDIVDNMIIVRTFLFLTNSGTPEGRLLEQNTGLKKLDKKYLEIDKLSTFISEDIENNKEVRKIFEDAGCQSLIGIKEIVEGLDIEHAKKSTAEKMLKYLKKNTQTTASNELVFDK